MKRLILVPIILFVSIFAAGGDNVRGPFRGEVHLDSSGEFTDELRLGLEDIGAVLLEPKHSEFLLAIELEVKIPSAVRRYRDSFALFIYRNIDPQPVPETTIYQGEQLAYEVIPPRNLIYFRLPVKPGRSFQPSPDTRTLETRVSVDQMPLLITVLPVMKGIPSFISSSEFRIRGRAVFEEVGYISFNVSHPDETEPGSFTLSIDGKPVQSPTGRIALPVGMHTVALVSSVYKPVTRNFGIERGKESVVDIVLENQVPMVYLEKPAGTTIYIDGEKIDLPSGTGLELSEGEHTVLFKLGDYSLSKKVYIERGKEYDISLFMDIVVRDKE